MRGLSTPYGPLRPPLAKFLEDIFFSDTIMYKGGKAIFLDFNPKKSGKIRKNSKKSGKVRKNPKKSENPKKSKNPLFPP